MESPEATQKNNESLVWKDVGKGGDQDEFLWKKLVKSASGSFSLQVGLTVLSFIYSLLLARFLKASGYGVYTYTITWINLLTVINILGLDTLATREISVYKSRSDWSSIRGFLLWTERAVLMISIVIFILAIMVARMLSAFSSEVLITFSIGLLLLPLNSLILIKKATMQGLHQVVKGQLPEMLFRPVLFILLICITYLFIGKQMNAQYVMIINVITAALALTIGIIQVIKTLPPGVKKVLPSYQTDTWIRSALPLLFISSMYFLNNKIDILSLGIIKGAEITGIYAAASRGAWLIIFVLIAINAVLAPTIAKLYTQRDILKLQKIVTRCARLAFFGSLPIAIFLIIFGNWFLLLFGPEFTQGYNALIIMSVTRLINTFTGSVDIILVMTGHERITAIGVGFTALLNILLNIMLIPKWGIEGAALATCFSMIIRHVFLVIWLYKKIGIHSTVLGKINFA